MPAPLRGGRAERFPRLRFGLPFAAVFLLFILAALPALAADDETLERFLARLGLVELQIVQLEKSLENGAVGPQEQQRLAQRLADLYAEQLMNSADDPGAYNDLVQRIQSLLSRFPAANTTALQVMLLQADYNRAETQIAQWIGDRANQQALTEARTILQEIAPQLDGHQRQLRSQVDGLFTDLDELPENHPELLAKEKEAQRLQAVLGRASYFAGWANYYLGLTQESGGEAHYRRAAEIFRNLLSIDEGDYANLDPEWLSLEVIWRARAMIGLGLTEAALGNVDASRACFRTLEQAATAPEIQDQAPYWFAQGLINAGRLQEVHEYAESKIAEFSGNATQGKVSLCVALVRAGFGAGSGDSSESRELAMLGIAGLAKLGQYNAVQQLLEKHHIPLDNAEGFFLKWMNGRRLFSQAQESKQAEDYMEAAEALSEALTESDAATQTAAAGHCRYELGWCYYRAGDFEAAARQFEQAITSLKAAGATEAANAAWMAFVSYKQLAEKVPRFTASAIDVLQTIKRDFPGHEHAKNADYYIAKLQRAAGSPEEAIRNLASIRPGDPNYLTSRYDLCVLLHQQWSEVDTPTGKQAALSQLRQAAEDYLRAAGSRGDPERQLRVTLLVVAAALGAEPHDAALARQFLDRGQALADRVAESSSALAEHRYRALQLARLEKNRAAQLEHAQWLAANARGSAYELSALIEVSRDLERRLEAASDAERKSLQEEAYAVYTRLVERLGDRPASAASEKNTRVALSRLAEYAHATGRYDEAARRLAPLLAVEPKNKDYLRRSGLANFEAENYEAALENWRTLTHGLPRGSEEWFEAKYYQIASLARTDADQARKTLENLQLFYPDYGSSPWREKFQALAQQL